MMNAEELKKFLAKLKNTDIEELEVELDGKKVFFKKSDVVTLDKEPEVVVKKKAIPLPDPLKPVKATMVGTFYHSQSKDHPPFVIEGENIVPGQKVGIIEAMKIIKDVASNVTGKISKVSVQDGQSVEYGQELFLVDTNVSSDKQ